MSRRNCGNVYHDIENPSAVILCEKPLGHGGICESDSTGWMWWPEAQPQPSQSSLLEEARVKLQAALDSAWTDKWWTVKTEIEDFLKRSKERA